MARSKRKVHTRVVPDRVIAEMRAAFPHVVARTASAIQAEVPAFGGPVRGERRRRIEAAVVAGLQALSDLLIGKARPEAEIDALFRQMGRAEALDGQTLESMRLALDVASREAWGELHRIVLGQGLSPTAVGQVVDRLFEQVGHLRDVLEAGHATGLEERNNDRRLAREELGRLLLVGAEPAVIKRVAAVAGWAIPHLLLVARMPLSDESAIVGAGRFGADVLIVTNSADVLVVGDERDRIVWLDEMSEAGGSSMIAVSLPADLEHVSDAVRLVRRALSLVEEGVIAPQAVVDCADHEVALWLHAEPMLQERLAARLLAPLVTETAHRREVLGHTLLIWLEQRASAPMIADQLGIHPQTVRYRLRTLEKLFGERMRDPTQAFPLLLALKSTLPVWLATATNSKQPKATRPPSLSRAGVARATSAQPPREH